jgi:hypothetical protein
VATPAVKDSLTEGETAKTDPDSRLKIGTTTPWMTTPIDEEATTQLRIDQQKGRDAQSRRATTTKRLTWPS